MSETPITNLTDKVSIGIPTFNRPDSIKRTLDSLLNQTHQNLEIIISDNCSPDKRIKEIITEYSSRDKRIVPYFQSENIGMIKNFEFVLEKATGNFFMWKSDDDIIEDNDFVHKLYTKLVETNSDFAFPDSRYLNKNHANGFTLKKVYSECVTKIDFLRVSTLTFSCLEFYGLYNLSKFDKAELKFNDKVVCPDLLYIPYLFLHHKIAFVANTYYIFGHESSKDGFKSNVHLFRDRQIVMRELIANFASTDLLTPIERKEIVANLLKYYEYILNEKYAISTITKIKTDIKNKIKILLRIEKN